MIPRRAWLIPALVALILVVTCMRSRADTPIDCNMVRQYVADHGRARALAWAIERGYSWKQISEARKCLAK